MTGFYYLALAVILLGLGYGAYRFVSWGSIFSLIVFLWPYIVAIVARSDTQIEAARNKWIASGGSVQEFESLRRKYNIHAGANH